MTFRTLDFSDEFLESYGSAVFSSKERALFVKALRLLDSDEQHPSLRVHARRGKLAGLWSASASLELRITFRREPNGRKTLMACTRHYR